MNLDPLDFKQEKELSVCFSIENDNTGNQEKIERVSQDAVEIMGLRSQTLGIQIPSWFVEQLKHMNEETT